MRKRKKETRNEEKQDLQKVQKRENRETVKIRTKKVENSDEKRREEKTSNKKWYRRKITKKKKSGGPRLARSHGTWSIAYDVSHTFFVAICLLRFPTCTAALPIYLNSLNSRSLVELSILNPLSWVLVLKNL